MLAACILKLLVIEQGSFAILLFEMELAKLDSGILVAGRVAAAPVQLLQQHQGVGSVRFGSNVLLEFLDSFFGLALIDCFGGLNDGGIS